MVAIVLIASVVSYGQDRVNRTKLFFSEHSKTITNSVGWTYNKTIGEWVDYQNVISEDKSYKEKYNSLQGGYMKSRTTFNFDSIQTKTVNFQDKKYIVLLVFGWKGRYKYPSIKQDWINYNVVNTYFIEEKEYQKLKNFSTAKITGSFTYDVEFEKYDEVKLLDLIQNEITNPKPHYSNREMVMMVTKTKDNLVRFLTPTISELFESTKYFPAIVDFSKSYFETDPDNFSKLFL